VSVVVTQASCLTVEQDSSLMALMGRMARWTYSRDGCVALPIARLQPLQGEAGDFARVFQVEFVFDVRTVCLHRFRAEM
jgi:hypothetical protein